VRDGVCVNEPLAERDREFDKDSVAEFDTEAVRDPLLLNDGLGVNDWLADCVTDLLEEGDIDEEGDSKGTCIFRVGSFAKSSLSNQMDAR